MSSNDRSSDYSVLKRKKELYQVDIKPSAIDNWRCLNPEVPPSKRVDCSVQTLTFLDIIKDRKVAKYYSDLANFEDKYLYPYEIIQFIYNNYPSQYYEQNYNKNVFSNIPFDKWYRLLDEKLKPGKATFISAFRSVSDKRPEVTGHAFVIGKNINGSLYVYDPQHYTYLEGYDGLHKYFSTEDFSWIVFIIERPKKGRRRSTTKSVSDQPVKKTRKISTKKSTPRSSSSKNNKKTHRKTHTKRDHSTKRYINKRNTRQKLIEKKRMTKKESPPVEFLFPKKLSSIEINSSEL